MRDYYEKMTEEELVDELTAGPCNNFADHSTYWPMCRAGDKAILYVFMCVAAVCFTLIVIMIILTFWLVPVLVG